MELQDAERKQADLDRMKRLATGLLGLAALIFLVALAFEERYPWVGFIRATAEAAMVGALADWFAVTALFRYPLGVKIPHTAIVPNRKDQIGRSLGRFVANNFLSANVLAAKIRSMDVAGRLGERIRDPENSRLLAGHAATGLAGAVQVLRDEDVEHFIERGITSRIRETEIAPLVGNALSVVAGSELRHEVLNGTINLIHNLLEQNKSTIRLRIDQETPWWMPPAIDDKIYRKVVSAIENTLTELRTDPDHPLRRSFDEAVDRFIVDLKTSPEVRARAEALKEDLLQHPSVRSLASRIWVGLREAVVAQSADPSPRFQEPLVEGLVKFGDALTADAVLREKINGWAERALVNMAESYRHEVGHLIEATVEQWDPDETTKKIELQVGKDLQFIRINGTLVGGLAGLLIHTLSLFF